MATCTIKFRNGETAQFKHEGRAGGSYTKRVELTEGWVTIIDEWGQRTSYPADTVEAVNEIPNRY